jgi:integrase
LPRPRKAIPTPGKRLRGRAWQLFWASAGHTYGVSVGRVSEGEAEYRRLELQLAFQGGKWPTWLRRAPAVKRYLRAFQPVPETADDLLAAYTPSLRAEVSPGWADTGLAHLRELADHAGKPLLDITSAEAQAFLAHVLATPGPFRKKGGQRSRGTRNRARAACSRFYRWAVRSGAVLENPFAGLGNLPESHPAAIVYLTRKERDTVLKACEPMRDGLAAWLALYAGLRRSEVARCVWSDVALDRGRLAVPAGKTGRRRVVPLAAALTERLSQAPKRRGRLVPWSTELAEWRYQARCLLVALRGACPKVPGQRIGWNAFRHTFGSLLAQAGVSLDKISAWMGNSPTVCRRHYAEFVPRDSRDAEIDLL